MAVAVAVVASVVAAITGAANPLNAIQFLPAGHWTYNVALETVYHIAGATGDVDASVGVDGQGSSQVVQGDTSGFVVGNGRVTEFGKSSLEVVDTAEPPVAGEVPVALEVAGGPYLVYRDGGMVVRLGEQPLTIDAGPWLGNPVASSDGTVWLPRVGAGLICQLPNGADRVTCPVLVPKNHRGAMSIVDDRPVFVDTSTDLLHPIERDGLGEGRALGIDIPDTAKIASTEVSGRLAILDADRTEMLLVDTALGKPQAPVRVDLPAGEYDAPVSTGTVVAIMDKVTRTLSTFDSDGEMQDQEKLPKSSGDPRLTRGADDRVYVDGAEGDHVLVVDTDGLVTPVPVGGEDGEPGGGSSSEPGDGDDSSDSDEDSDEDSDDSEEADLPDEPEDEDPPPVPASAPGAPPGVTATAGDGSVRLSWEAAADNRSPITAYTVSWAGGTREFAADARGTTIGGLTNGTRYTFTVAARNSEGTGPGAASGAVTPVAVARPATAPPNIEIDIDIATNDATVFWGRPNLGGGTLVHYVTGVTGLANQTVPGQTAQWQGIPPSDELVFTVSAVTRTPDGRTLTGATASRRIDVTPEIVLTRGAPFEDEAEGCDAPDCARLNVAMTGFAPNTEYLVFAESSDDGEFADIFVVTDDNGAVTFNDLFFDGAGQDVVVTADGPEGQTESNELFWEPR
ncbi:MAG: fibronectin type III domain-containing protein [Actinophytocola sp.]|uniref:fibronectin type III domain-containing protein n=1 Tax=Actinophytocola sp. TaxID=1872138 RepID=UPI003D6C03C2